MALLIWSPAGAYEYTGGERAIILCFVLLSLELLELVLGGEGFHQRPAEALSMSVISVITKLPIFPHYASYYDFFESPMSLDKTVQIQAVPSPAARRLNSML
jgi:hypothetical protein